MTNLRLGTVPVFLILCIVLGGASNAGFWVNAALQLTALAIIVWALMAKRQTPMPAAGRSLLWLLGAGCLLVLLQLIPLPPGIWTMFPGRDAVSAGFGLLGMPLPWLAWSLAPHETISSALWLLPAVAVLVGIIRLGHFKSAWIAWAIAITMVAGVLLGTLQITNPSPTSPYYFYEITNLGVAVGFFANANHMATLLVVAIPFLSALFVTARSKSRSARNSSAVYVILAGALAVTIVGIVINTSLAGIGLMVPVLGASYLMIRSRKKPVPVWAGVVVGALAALSLAAVLSAPFENNLIGANVADSPFSRFTTFRLSLSAAGDYLPMGSGIGTFVDIYPSYEALTQIDRYYINHVHNDYIELALETGVFGLTILLLFLVWWTRRTIAIWSAETPDYFMRAATIATAAILAHSVVDYPLRTAAISALFAACCALMTDSRPRAGVAASSTQKRARHLSAD